MKAKLLFQFFGKKSFFLTTSFPFKMISIFTIKDFSICQEYNVQDLWKSIFSPCISSYSSIKNILEVENEIYLLCTTFYTVTTETWQASWA